MSAVTVGQLLGKLAEPPGRGEWERFRVGFLDRIVAAGIDAPVADWVAAWREVAAAMDAALQQRIEAEIVAAAGESRYPARLRQAEMPDAAARDGMRNRIIAAGVPIEQLGAGASPAARGAAAEATWQNALAVVDGELLRWRRVADRVAAWQRPWLPPALALGGVALLLLVPAAWFGGVIPAPAWWEPVNRAFWSLPWP